MRTQRLSLVIVSISVAIVAAAAESAPQPANPGPYVTVYRDRSVAFQVRRDRIKRDGEQVYNVWLRWLWAKPRPHKGQSEAARVIVADVDCRSLKVRELAVLHKDRNGKIFDAEEVSAPDAAPWKSFEPRTGAAAAIERLCEFLPKLSSDAGAGRDR
jgi:hypothetical protein